MDEWAKASKLLNALSSSESDSDSESESRKSKRLKVNRPNWVHVNDSVKGCSFCNKRTIHPKKKRVFKGKSHRHCEDDLGLVCECGNIACMRCLKGMMNVIGHKFVHVDGWCNRVHHFVTNGVIPDDDF